MVFAKGYEFFDHTADIGIRASGRDVAEVLTHLAQGLTELVAEDSDLRPVERRFIELQAPDAETLLLHWLQELLYWFSTDRFLPVRYALTVTGTSLRGELVGERFDPARHAQGREVKAITRHGLRLAPRDGGWDAEVIVDI
jgi:SHS2 domain-containing protein